MSVKQLYQLQELDLEIESSEQSLKQITAQLGESETVVAARNRLASEQQRRQELVEQQRSIEWEIDDLNSKLAPAEEELYSGRIRNPKELANLQQEIEIMKTRRGQMEEKVLEIMAQMESCNEKIGGIGSELKKLEAEWQSQQQQLSAEMAEVKAVLAGLQEKRRRLTSEIDPEVIEVYGELKEHKGVAVVKVEQGICRGCRISLPVSELQRVRGGNLVRCGSCGRILFLA